MLFVESSGNEWLHIECVLTVFQLDQNLNIFCSILGLGHGLGKLRLKSMTSGTERKRAPPA